MLSLLNRKGSTAASPIITGPDPNLIIEARDVVKTYNTGTQKVAALKGVSFGATSGEMVAVMGPSGSGKTTLLNTLSGLDTIDSGAIWLEGEDLSTMKDRKRTSYRAKRMGFREYGTLAERYVREFDGKWLRGGAPADEPLLGSGDLQSLADLGNSFEVVRTMRIAPFTKETILQLAAATVAPVAPLLLTMMPLEELLKKLLGILF